MSTSEEKQRSEKARKRAKAIMSVRSNQITGNEAALQLGISRKTYYKWEKRGLKALLRAVEDQPQGRPEELVDKEKEAMRKKIPEMEKELEIANQKAAVRKIFHAWELEQARAKNKAKSSKKKKR